MNTLIRVTARDPVVSRDSRPFGAGQGRRMRTTGWPLPGMVAGSLRTAVAKATGQSFTGTVPADLLKYIAVHGLFPFVGDDLYLPSPANALHPPDTDTPLRATPREHEGGCDWPGGAKLRPVMPHLADDAEDFKPAKKSPAFWPQSAYEAWLREGKVTFDDRFLMALQADDRDHVAMDDTRGAAADGLLFTTAGLPLTHLRRYEPKEGVQPPPKPARKPFAERYAEVTLASRADDRPAPAVGGESAGGARHGSPARRGAAARRVGEGGRRLVLSGGCQYCSGGAEERG